MPRSLVGSDSDYAIARWDAHTGRVSLRDAAHVRSLWCEPHSSAASRSKSRQVNELLDHVLGQDGVHVSQGGFASADPYEQEADCFAAGLIMPETLFRQALRKLDPGLAAVESIAGLCKASLPAAGIRCAEITDHPIAVIVSTGPVIDYCILSTAMKSLPDLTWLRRGSPVPPCTATAQLNGRAHAVLNGERAAEETDCLDWLGGSRSVKLVRSSWPGKLRQDPDRLCHVIGVQSR